MENSTQYPHLFETQADDPFGPQIYAATSASSVVDSEKARMLEMQDVLEKQKYLFCFKVVQLQCWSEISELTFF